MAFSQVFLDLFSTMNALSGRPKVFKKGATYSASPYLSPNNLPEPPVSIIFLPMPFLYKFNAVISRLPPFNPN